MGERLSFKSPSGLLLCVFLLASLSLQACLFEKKGKLPPDVEGITIISTGILQGNMAPFERHYSRGRVRRFGDPARVATVVDRLIEEARDKGRHPLVVDLGDNLSGSAEALLTKGDLIARVLGDMPLDGALLGNLEFTHGQEVLEKYFRKYEIPYLASNVRKEGGKALPFAKDYLQVDLGSLKVTLAALVPPNLEFVCLEENVKGLEVWEGIDRAFREASKEKEKSGSDLLLMLSQESLGSLSKGFEEAIHKSSIDLLFGLDFDREGEVRKIGESRLLAFPGHNQGQRVRVTELNVHKERGILSVDSWFEMVDAQEVAAKQSINAYLEKGREKFKRELNREIAQTKDYLNREFWTDGDSGNLLTDALKEETGSDMAIVNSGGIASSLAPGSILLRDLYRVIPYQNRVVQLKVSGKNLKRFLVETLGRGSPLQVSSLSLKIARKKNVERGFELLQCLHDGRKIKDDQYYELTSNDFVLGRSPQLEAKNGVSKGKLMRDVLIDWLEKQKVVERPERGRIVLEKN